MKLSESVNNARAVMLQIDSLLVAAEDEQHIDTGDAIEIFENARVAIQDILDSWEN